MEKIARTVRQRAAAVVPAVSGERMPRMHHMLSDLMLLAGNQPEHHKRCVYVVIVFKCVTLRYGFAVFIRCGDGLRRHPPAYDAKIPFIYRFFP